MSKRILLIIFLFNFKICVAQNLVPNPSFENYVLCPTTLNQIYRCEDWSNWGYNPDYFNSCSGSSLVGVPLNYYGHQMAVSGNAYCSFLNHSVPSVTHDFIGAQLLQSLVIGQTYFVSLHICHIQGNCSTNKIGVRFSTLPFDSINHPVINNFAHVYTDSIVVDTANWFTIKGSFIADSNYSYIAIGNFFNNPATNSFCGNIWSSYYYLDDVCVATDSTICYSIPSAILEEDNYQNVEIYPNPVMNKFSITNLTNGELNIYNTAGEKVLKAQIQNQKTEIDVSNLSQGIYFAKILSGKKISVKKLIKAG